MLSMHVRVCCLAKKYKSRFKTSLNLIHFAPLSWKARNKQIQFAFHYPWKIFQEIFLIYTFQYSRFKRNTKNRSFHRALSNEKLFQKTPKEQIKELKREKENFRNIIHKFEETKTKFLGIMDGLQKFFEKN